MGQIVIDIPNRKTRRYVLADAAEAEALLEALETAAIRVKTNPEPKLSHQALQDHRDGQRADRILRNSRRFYSQAELEEMLGV